MSNTQDKKQKNSVGRNWFDLTEEDKEKGRTEESIIAKCQEVWGIGGSDAEAAFYADISVYSLSRYLKAHEDIRELRDKLKEKPILKARQTVVAKLGESYGNAMDYLSRKKKDEFSTRQEMTGADGGPIKSELNIEIEKALEDVL